MSRSTQNLTIPGNLCKDYEEYKISTNIVIKWLSQNGSLPSQTRFKVDELQIGASNARTNKLNIPEEVHRAFRESVAKRKKATRWFTSQELRAGKETSQTTDYHSHFTSK